MLKIFRKIRYDLMGENKTGKYMKYAIGEIILVVIGILIAVSLNNWNENRKQGQIEHKILVEISNGLKEDVLDLKGNVRGHNLGLKACDYFRKVLNDETVSRDSIGFHFHRLTRDFVSIQNTSGYQSLKSRGLEIIKNDSIRSNIIKLYEQDYTILRKLEEEYQESQFFENYYKDINAIFSPHFMFDYTGKIVDYNFPLKLNYSEKNSLLSYILKIEGNRQFLLNFYNSTENKLNQLLEKIDESISQY